MNPSSSSSSSSSLKIQKKCVPAPVPATAKIERRKRHSPRSPLQDINCITSMSCSSGSNTSIEAPRGCLRFLLAHSSSYSTSKPPSNRPNSLCKNPKSARLKSKSGKENSSKRTTAPKPQKSKKNPPCLYQWQSGKKPTSRNGPKFRTCRTLCADAGHLSTLANGSEDLEQQEQQCPAMMVDGDAGEPNEADCTPPSKFPNLVNGSDSYCTVDKDETENSKTSSKTKTPPVQPSVSPEIQCGSSVLSRTVTPACYGAGHVISGVTDKRKCRPRGILVVADNELDFGKVSTFGSLDESDDNNVIGIANTCTVSPIPLPADAWMHWLLSPCNEEDEDSEDGSHLLQRLADPTTFCSPSSTLSGHGFSSDACAASNLTSSLSHTKERRRRSRRRRSGSLASPNGLPEFDNVPDLSPPTIIPGYKDVTSQEKRIGRNNINGENSPLSACSLGSGNIMKTPQSDSSPDTHISLPWLYVDDHRKQNFDSELDSIAEAFRSMRLSPKSQVSMWNPTSSSFQFDCLTTPSNSVDFTQFHKVLGNRASWFSNSMSENMSQPSMRISWREGLVSRIFEMDEFDCCRCLSDEEEEDANRCSNDQLKSHRSPELSINADYGHTLTNDFEPPECVNNEAGADGKGKDRIPAQLPGSCAESITIDGDGLAASEDLDWKLCYKNQLFEV